MKIKIKIPIIEKARLYKRVFEGDDGEKVLRDLCKRFGLLSSTSPKKSDAEARFEDGERNVVLYILSKCNYDIERYLKDLEQHKKMEMPDDDG